MTRKNRLFRFFGGFAAVLVLLGVIFTLANSWCKTYGATPDEVKQVYAGDDILPTPQVEWTHGVTIHASPAQVWPWIIQIGDTRGGFYSYTFIENLIAQGSHYANAGRVHTEWQNPEPGQGIIAGVLQIKQVEQGQSMLAAISTPDYGWTWLWRIEPQADGNTRLVVRMRIQAGVAAQNPLITNIINLGGFVMEKGMLDGLKARAEGNVPADWMELAGVVAWVLNLVIGLAAAWLTLVRQAWARPLGVGIAGVASLMGLTFLQPQMGVRFMLDLFLVVVLFWPVKGQ
jgi:hypothetical protein